MNESKIQPLGAFVLCGAYIFDLLFSCQLGPCFFPSLVPSDVIILDEEEEHNVVAAYRKEYLIAAPVCTQSQQSATRMERGWLTQWPVIFTIDVGTHDVPSLNEHVIKGRRHCAGSHRVGVPRIPGDNDGMTIWIRENSGQ